MLYVSVHYWHGHRFFLQWIAAVVLQFGDDPQKVYVAPSLKRTCDVLQKLQRFQDPLMATPQIIPAIFFLLAPHPCSPAVGSGSFWS